MGISTQILGYATYLLFAQKSPYTTLTDIASKLGPSETLTEMVAEAEPQKELKGVDLKKWKLAIREGDKAYSAFRLSEALQHFEFAHSQTPKNRIVLKKLFNAQVFYATHLYDTQQAGSEEYFQKAVQSAEALQRQDPTDPESEFFVAYSLGSLALFKGGKEKVKLGWKVKDHAQRALTLDPLYWPAHVALGVFYKEVAALTFWERFFGKLLYGKIPEHTYEDALAEFEKARKMEPRLPYIYWEMGVIYERMDDTPRMIEALKKFLSMPDVLPRDPYLRTQAKKKLADYGTSLTEASPSRRNSDEEEDE